VTEHAIQIYMITDFNLHMTQRRLVSLPVLFSALLVLAAIVSACGNGGGKSASPPALPRDVAESDYQTTPSGLKIYDFNDGDRLIAESGDRVTVNYTGWLRSDSTQFDSSIGRDPFSFQIGGRVIEGWNEGVQGMKVGGERQLVIPPELGYGASGQGPIPPNATLIFEIEMLEIEKPDSE
jgi:FKBP-type peptidyl-prolyl cis-trans isomerase